MEFRQIEHFLAVAEEQHFTRAAKRVNIVQSGLSASIRALEIELGADLFLRSTRRVELTAAGQAFYVKAQQILLAVRDARDAVTAVRTLDRGTLAIGTVQSLEAFIDLTDLLGRFHGAHPGIDIRLCQSGAKTLIEKVADGRVDLAFVPLTDSLPEGVSARMIACEELVLACAPAHPLAGAKNLTLDRLQHLPFVDFQPDQGTRRLIDHAFAQAGCSRHIAFEVSDLATMLNLAAHDLGVALVPETVARSRQSPLAGAVQAGTVQSGGMQAGTIAIATLAEPEICWELAVAFADSNATTHAATVRTKSPAAHAFLNLLLQARGLDTDNASAA